MDVGLRFLIGALWAVPPILYVFIFRKAYMGFARFFPALYPGAGLAVLGAAVKRMRRAGRLNAGDPDGFLKLQGLAVCPECGKRINLKKREACRRCRKSVEPYACPACGEGKLRFYTRDRNTAWGYLKQALIMVFVLNLGFTVFGYDIPLWILAAGLSAMGAALLGAGLIVILTTTSGKKKRVVCEHCGKDMPRSELLSRPPEPEV